MSQKSKKTNVTHQHVDPFKLLRKVAACADTPLSGVFRRVTDLASLEDATAQFNPYDYTNAYEFRHDYLCRELIRKYDNLGTSTASDRLNAAMTAFYEAESSCESVSIGLAKPRILPTEKQALGEPALKLAREFILSVLGPEPNLNELTRRSGFSGGASLTMKRRTGSDTASKFSMLYPEVTRDCLDLARYMIGQSPIWSERFKAFRLFPGNRITTVPKNYKIDRTIAIEPSMNMYIQKGIGAIIRHRLHKVRINLNDQTINQRYAKLGSETGTLATIDLSAASDSVSNKLVEILLPPAWFELLQITRSSEGILPNGDTHVYHKIASMGNGYTFELESLIFWALSKSVCSQDDIVSVYGDDIIVPTDKASLVIDVLAYCGFKTNSDKTFTTGLFRESCGKHYFNGVDVSPFYHKEAGAKFDKMLLLANNMYRHQMQHFGYDFYKSPYDYVVSTLPESWRKPRIPDGIGDGALVGTLADVQPNFKFGYYKTKVLANVPRHSEYSSDKDLGRYLAVLKDLEGDTQEPTYYTQVDPTSRLKTQTLRVWQWCDLNLDH